MAKYDGRKIRKALKDNGFPVMSVKNASGSEYGYVWIYMNHGKNGYPLITAEQSIEAKKIAAEAGNVPLDKIFMQY